MLRDIGGNGPIVRARLVSGLLLMLALAAPAPAANIVVDTTDGSNSITLDGQCSLHEAILALMSSEERGGCRGGDPFEADTITLAVTGTIRLEDALPAINEDVHLIGPGARLLTISGNGNRQVLRVGSTQPSGDDVNVMVEGVTIARGRAFKNGGGILNFGRLTVRNTSFVDNQAPEDGGAISNEGRGARLTVLNSTFSGNSGIETGPEQEEGGAIVNIDGEATIVNSTFVGNHAPDTGGAIHNSEPTAEVILINCTFADNSANGGGGAIFTERSGAITLRNTLLAANLGDNCSVGTDGQIIDEGGNLDDGATCGLTLGMSIPNGAAGLDPPGLRDNGGPTDTVALTAASDAIDLGLDDVCADPDPRRVNNFDQRGSVRPIDGDGDGSASCDIGAFESQHVPSPSPGPIPGPIPTPPPPSPAAPLADATPVDRQPRLRCTRTACRVRIECIAIQGSGSACDNRIDVFVRARAFRDDLPRNAPNRVLFATGRVELQPGASADATLQLTPRGRRLARASTRKKHRGVMQIQNATGTGLVNSTAVTLRLRRR